MAAWTATELFNTFGGDVAIRLTPSSGGRFEVYLDGEEAYNNSKDGQTGIDYDAVSRLKMTIHERLAG